MNITLTIASMAVATIYVVYLLLRDKRKAPPSLNQYSKEITAFKSTAEEIQLDLDHCQFKDSSFMQEVEEDNSDYKNAIRLAGALAGSSIGYYYTPLVRKETVCSVIFYSSPGLRGGKRFFQEFPTDLTNL